MMNDPLRIIFMGTPDFAASALSSLIDDGKAVIAAYSQPPRPKGRGQDVQKSPVHILAEGHQIPVFTPLNFKDEKSVQDFKDLKPDLVIVAAYGLILPKSILDIPVYGCLNIHASLLPRWRGAAPIQRAIWEGDDKTGVTIMRMEEGLDTGPMISKEEIAITDKTTASNLHDDLSAIGGAMTLKVIDTLKKDGVLEWEVQPEEGVTYASMLKKEDGKINWLQSASEIDRQVRALTPWPGTFCMNGEKRLKILSLEKTNQRIGQPAGTILDKSGHIACGQDSVIKLITVQPENKKAMDGTAAFNGGYLKEGDILS